MLFSSGRRVTYVTLPKRYPCWNRKGLPSISIRWRRSVDVAGTRPVWPESYCWMLGSPGSYGTQSKLEPPSLAAATFAVSAKTMKASATTRMSRLRSGVTLCLPSLPPPFGGLCPLRGVGYRLASLRTLNTTRQGETRCLSVSSVTLERCDDHRYACETEQHEWTRRPSARSQARARHEPGSAGRGGAHQGLHQSGRVRAGPPIRSLSPDPRRTSWQEPRLLPR